MSALFTISEHFINLTLVCEVNSDATRNFFRWTGDHNGKKRFSFRSKKIRLCFSPGLLWPLGETHTHNPFSGFVTEGESSMHSTKSRSMLSRDYIQNIGNFNLSKPPSLTQLYGFLYIVGHVEQNSLGFLF